MRTKCKYMICLPTLLIRNASLSTSVTLPALDSMNKTEIHFGTQKVSNCCVYYFSIVLQFILFLIYSTTLQQDMYKNAEKVLNEKENLSKTQIRNNVALVRIELNVRKVQSMIHLTQPPSHDEVI